MEAPIETKIATEIITQISKTFFSFTAAKAKEKYKLFRNKQAAAAFINKVKDYEKVKTIWQREKDVKLSDFYYPSRVIFSKPQQNNILVESLSDIPMDVNYVVEGIVGQGKSIFLRHLCIQELGKKSSKRIPILLEFRKLDKNNSLKESLFQSAQNLGLEINDALFDLYAKSGTIVLLLDGFDEIDENIIRATITQIENWTERYPLLQIIATSRPNSDISNCRLFEVIKLAKLSSNDFEPFLQKHIPEKTTLTNLLRAISECSSEISGLLTTPLLLTLLAIVYQCEKVIPSELSEFFERLFTTVFTRHDSTKPAFRRPHKTRLNESKLKQLFESFCYSVMKHPLTATLTTDQFTTAFKNAIEISGIDCDQEYFLHDITKIACLMQDDGNIIEFIHKSLLDYFTAAFIAHCTEDQAKAFYQQVANFNINHIRWAQPLLFLSKIDEYRYTKYCVLPILTNLLQDIPAEETRVNEDVARKYFKIKYKNAKAHLTIRNNAINFNHITYTNTLPSFIMPRNTFEEQLFPIFDFYFTNTPTDHIRSIAIKNGYSNTDGIEISLSVTDLELTLRQQDISFLTDFLQTVREVLRECNAIISKEEIKKSYMISGL